MKKILILLSLLLTTLTFSQTIQNITPGFYYGSIHEGGVRCKYLIKVREDGVVDRMTIPSIKEGSKEVIVDAFSDYEYKKTVDVGGITTMQYIKYDKTNRVTILHKFILIKITNNTLKIFHMKYYVKEGDEVNSYHLGSSAIFNRDYTNFIKDVRFD